MAPGELKRLRLRHRLKQAELARLLAVTRNTVTRWEIGTHPVPPLVARLMKRPAALRKLS